MKRGFLERELNKKGLTNNQWIILGIVIFLLVVFIIAVNYSSTVKNIFIGEGELGTLPVTVDDCTNKDEPDKFCNDFCINWPGGYVHGLCLGALDPDLCGNGNLFSNKCCCKYPDPPLPPPLPPPPPPPPLTGCAAMTNPNSATAACVTHSPGGNCPTQFIHAGLARHQCCCPECWQTSDCPDGQECQFYECKVPQTCGTSTAPQCNGPCPAGKTCKHQPLSSGDTGICQCYTDPAQACSDFVPPGCGDSAGNSLCMMGEVCSPYYQSGGGSECKCFPQ